MTLHCCVESLSKVRSKPVHQASASLDRLRSETAEKHQAVESALDILSPTLTVDRYASVLRLMAAAFIPWEEALSAWCPQAYKPLWSGREKAARAITDLRVLGYSQPVEPLVWTQPLEAPGLWLGSLYVMEGSTLGGQFIARHLEQHFGWSAGCGYTFFRPYGTNTSERWRAVCSAIAEAPYSHNQIVAGSHLSYDFLLASLAR